jgi:leader peptidase (prepilin peptidase)/N-methyltransferase
MNIGYLIYFFTFVFGAIIGSFINVLALRYKTGLSVAKGRSKCFHCGTPLKWFELVPLLSFIILGKKCRTCKIPFSWRYFLVEVISGAMFVGILWRQVSLWSVYEVYQYGLIYSALFFVYYAFVFSLLLAIVLYDIRHKIIPNTWVYTFIVLAFAKLGLFLYCRQFVLLPMDYFDIFAGFIFFFLFASLWFLSRGRAIGFGDAKLVLGIGALLGFVSGLSAIIIAFWVGAVYGVGTILYSHMVGKGKKVTFASEVPFAPFLILGTAVVFLFRFDVLGLGELIKLL